MSATVESIGWVGGLLLALCGLPQAIQTWKDKHADGLNWGFVGMWAGGEALTLVYVLEKSTLGLWPLLANYGANLLFLSIILRWKLFPARQNEPGLEFKKNENDH